jgi:hypothetical protein
VIDLVEIQRGGAQQIDDIDGQIEKLQADKKAVYDAMKEDLPPNVNKAWRAAVKLRQKRRDSLKRIEMEDHDALVWDILQALEAPVIRGKKKSGTEVATRIGAGAENSPAEITTDQQPSVTTPALAVAAEGLPPTPSATPFIADAPSKGPGGGLTDETGNLESAMIASSDTYLTSKLPGPADPIEPQELPASVPDQAAVMTGGVRHSAEPEMTAAENYNNLELPPFLNRAAMVEAIA